MNFYKVGCEGCPKDRTPCLGVGQLYESVGAAAEIVAGATSIPQIASKIGNTTFIGPMLNGSETALETVAIPTGSLVAGRVNQRIRFRGINTAELIKDGIPAGEAPGRGEQAKAFVEEKLKDIEFIVIKTYKTDMYGRFVADVFYHPMIKKKEEIAEKGFFLNLQMLEEGLADRVTF